jgi:hypothetical protein
MSVIDADDDPENQVQPMDEARPVLILRDEPVILAASVARGFEVETREVIQAIKRNPDKFSAKHAFELTREEVDLLRSQGVISKPGRGGSRFLPWALSQKGVARLATVLSSPKALAATDVMLDVFIDVYQQLARGQRTLSISSAPKLIPDATLSKQVQDFRSKLLVALDSVLNTVIDPKHQTTIRDELGEIGGNALSLLKDHLRTKGLENDKIAAETLLVLEKVRELREKTAADALRSKAETEGILLKNLDTKIGIVEKLLKMAESLEPNAIASLYAGFDQITAATGSTPLRSLPASPKTS